MVFTFWFFVDRKSFFWAFCRSVWKAFKVLSFLAMRSLEDFEEAVLRLWSKGVRRVVEISVMNSSR